MLFLGCNEFKHYSCLLNNQCSGDGLWFVETPPNSKWPHSGVCRALSTSDPKTRGSYNISMDLMGIHGCNAAGCGHPGFVFNAQGPLKFEFVYFQ